MVGALKQQLGLALHKRAPRPMHRGQAERGERGRQAQTRDPPRAPLSRQAQLGQAPASGQAEAAGSRQQAGRVSRVGTYTQAEWAG